MPDHINPAAIPGDNLRPDMVEIGATKMDTIGTKVATQGATVLTTWQRLAHHYEAPESATLFSVMDPVKTNAEAFNTNIDMVSSALKTYAAEVEPIKAELAKIKTEAENFVVAIAGGVEQKHYSRAGMTTETVSWDKDQDSVDQNNSLIHRVNAQMVLLWAAERKCANAIYDIIGFPHIGAATQDNPNGYGVSEIPDGTDTPWGKSVKRTEGCGEKAAGAVKGFVWDGVIVGGIWGTVKGLGTLVLGYNPNTGDWFSGDAYGAAWGNLGMLAVGLTALSVPGAPVLINTMPGPVGDFLRKGQDTVVAAGKGLIAWDKWKDDPAAAAGESVFNVASIIVPVGAATAPVRAGASTTAAVIRTTAKVLDVVDPVSGIVKVGAAGAKLSLPVISDLMKTLDLSALDHLGGTGGKIDLPDIKVEPVGVPGVGHDGMSVHVPETTVPADVPVRHPGSVDAPVKEPALVGSGSGHSSHVGSGSGHSTDVGSGSGHSTDVGSGSGSGHSTDVGSGSGSGHGTDVGSGSAGHGGGDTSSVGSGGDHLPGSTSTDPVPGGSGPTDHLGGDHPSGSNPGSPVGGSADSPVTGPRAGDGSGPVLTHDVPPADHHEVARPADQQPTVGDSEHSIGTWEEINRGEKTRGLLDQAYATGVDLPANGHPIEYVVRDPNVGKVEFDGHQYRGDPPTEVFQEVKGDYSLLYKPFPKGKTTAEKVADQVNDWVTQARRQQAVIESRGATYEFILTRNPELVETVQKAFDDADIDADVVYLPYQP